MSPFDRTMRLYKLHGKTCLPESAPLVYTHTTLAHERQLADDLAKQHGLRQGEGHVAIFMADNLEESINKLELMP